MLILEVALRLVAVFAISWVLVLVAQILARPFFLHAAIYLPKRKASAVLYASAYLLNTLAGSVVTAALIAIFVNAAVVVNLVI